VDMQKIHINKNLEDVITIPVNIDKFIWV